MKKQLQQKGYRSGYSKRSTDLVDQTEINVLEQTTVIMDLNDKTKQKKNPLQYGVIKIKCVQHSC